jgi:hypothetical protein
MMARSLILAVLAAGLVAGCSNEYARKSGDTSKEAAQLKQMMLDLRSAGDVAYEAVLKTQLSGDMDDTQQQGMLLGMKELTTAESVDVVAVEQFGDHVYRAHLKIKGPQGQYNAFYLLTKKDDRLYWVGRG